MAQRLTRITWCRFLFSRNSADASVAAALFTTGLDEKYEIKGSRVGVFAVRGRRGKMEDMFDYVNQTDGLGIELYGVFDGHGSEVTPFPRFPFHTDYSFYSRGYLFHQT